MRGAAKPAREEAESDGTDHRRGHGGHRGRRNHGNHRDHRRRRGRGERRAGRGSGGCGGTAPPPAGLTDRAVRRLAALRLRRWFPAAALAAGYLVQVLFRLVLARHLDYPSVHPDEESYLVLARVLAGRPTTEMPVGVVIPGGYPLLISPRCGSPTTR